MPSENESAVQRIFEEAIAVHWRFAERGTPQVVAAADAICAALKAGGKVLAFGNGGSASDAEHLAAELVGRFEIERASFPAIALTPDSSVMTAIANDYGYGLVFVRQVQALGNRGDVAVGISTSGKSINVESGLAAAKEKGLVTIAMTGGDGGRMGANADIHLNVAEQSTARVQEVHRTIMHAVCTIVDREFSD